MTKVFNELYGKIQKQGSNATTPDEFNNLIQWYGEAFHEFVEHDPLSKLPLKQLKIPAADFNTASAAIKGFLDSATLTFGGTVTAKSIATKATKCQQHAQVDANSAKALTGDDASEDFSWAAMWYYEEAISIYCGKNLAKATMPAAGLDKFNYANALNNAAQMLIAAKGKEDPTDYAEKIAETLLATYLFNAATAVYADLQKAIDNGSWGYQPRQDFDDNKKAADDGAKDSQKELSGYKI